jgi:hypothetical protein
MGERLNCDVRRRATIFWGGAGYDRIRIPIKIDGLIGFRRYPWARQPKMNSLLAAEAMRNLLESSAFVEVSWADKTDFAMTWFAELTSCVFSTAEHFGGDGAAIP